MGYTTDFWGEFSLDRPLTPEHKAYLEAFASTRRMRRRDVGLPDPLREAVGLPFGHEGAYYVGGHEPTGWTNEDRDAAGILDYNDAPGTPPFPDSPDPDDRMAAFGERWTTHREARVKLVRAGTAQPGLWCQWVPNEDGTALVWDEGEKFYEYVEWIKYLIDHFLAPWGYKVNGEVRWTGEDSSDRGIILVVDNEVKVGIAKDVYTFADGSTKED